jgi:hypothetical protein
VNASGGVNGLGGVNGSGQKSSGTSPGLKRRATARRERRLWRRAREDSMEPRVRAREAWRERRRGAEE